MKDLMTDTGGYRSIKLNGSDANGCRSMGLKGSDANGCRSSELNGSDADGCRSMELKGSDANGCRSMGLKDSDVGGRRSSELRGTDVCRDPLQALKAFFGYDSFRTYNNEPLQEKAVRAAIAGESIITIFPTGGGKSITFQIPALMAWKESRALTVVISPLQSLMKDQVDNLLKHHITEAVTINGLLNPVERAQAVKRVEEGDVAIMYVSPEQLRSGTFTRILHKRNIARFVIDEAHCFSSWGHDFRVDYLYIGEFLSELRKAKNLPSAIPVSCFTATAKQQVINEIKTYFYRENAIHLTLFRTEAERENLHYHVTACADGNAKYENLVRLISEKPRPTIVYVSRTTRAVELAAQLSKDGIPACPFHGQMPVNDKIRNQDAFIKNEIGVMVATSAFGMGVDKKDIGLVVHYDISSSLEAYLQESGRAGRDPTLQADCHLLYNENDLDDHFSLHSFTEISIDDINKVWQQIKRSTQTDTQVTCSAFEIARYCGWNMYEDMRVSDVATKVKVCISALEQAGFLRRKKNAPISFANSLQETKKEAVVSRINGAQNLTNEERAFCNKLMDYLIDAHEKKDEVDAEEIEARTQIDQLACKLARSKREVFHHINILRELGLLADDLDISVGVRPGVAPGHLRADLKRFHLLETCLVSSFKPGKNTYLLREINELASHIVHAESGIQNIRTLLDIHSIRQNIRRQNKGDSQIIEVELIRTKEQIFSMVELRYDLCRFIIDHLFGSIDNTTQIPEDMKISISVVSILNAYRDYLDSRQDSASHSSFASHPAAAFAVHSSSKTFLSLVDQASVEDALLFMMHVNVLKLFGGFLVGYNRMQIERIVRSDRREYTEADYAPFRNYYRQKNEGVHIVGEYARLMIENPEIAKNFVRDYFNLDQEEFVRKHFKGLHGREIKRRLTTTRYKELFGSLSETQRAVIEDVDSKIIAVAAGPGSGKTRMLVHKLASLLLLETHSPERILVLTFTRSAATEFKTRLRTLVGALANHVEVKTFHSYCLDILGRIPTNQHLQCDIDERLKVVSKMQISDKINVIGKDDLTNAGNPDDSCIERAVRAINDERAEPHRILKSALVLDEAQDMGKNEYDLVCALMNHNPNMRVIAVGDDDQNIFQFRGSKVRHFRKFTKPKSVKKYYMTDNFRCAQAIVNLSNAFVETIPNRVKSKPCTSVRTEQGCVDVTEYVCENMIESLVDQLIVKQSHMEGSCAVLAQTNEEASIIAGSLLKRGIRAKLIQSDDRIQLRNLVEMRYFMKKLDDAGDGAIIAIDQWDKAYEQFNAKYAGSACLKPCRAILNAFREDYLIPSENQSAKPPSSSETDGIEADNIELDGAGTDCIEPNGIGTDCILERATACRRGDFETFLSESAFEDFLEKKQNTVIVSTLHKSKGCEFDSVYVLLKNFELKDDRKRMLYVAMTRARRNLFVHCNSPVFENMHDRMTAYRRNEAIDLPKPDTLAFMLTYHDVNLGYFIDRKKVVLSVQSGTELAVRNEYFYANTPNGFTPVAKCSHAFSEKLKELCKVGYNPVQARACFILAWRPRDNDPETAVLLPFVKLERKEEERT